MFLLRVAKYVINHAKQLKNKQQFDGTNERNKQTE